MDNGKEITVQSFSNDLFGALTVVEIEGNPWFIGKQVAGILGYVNGSRDIQNHCKYVKLLKSTDTVLLEIPPRGIQIINEFDLYRLIMRSKLPNAEKFQDWVCEEVLPSIRKTGSYSLKEATPPKPMSQLQMISHIALELDSTNKVVAEHSTKLLEIEASQKDIKEHFAKKAELQKLLPGVNPKSLRAKINQIVRSYSTKNSREYWETWGELYKEFYYRNSINVKLRAKRKRVSPLDYLEKNELLEDTMALAVELFS